MVLTADPVAVPLRSEEPLNVIDFGADPTGATSSTAAILAAVQASLSQRRGVYVPGGTFLLGTPLDFSSLNVAGLSAPSAFWYGSFVCDVATTFQAGAYNGPMVNLEAPAGVQFIGWKIVLGRLTGLASQPSQDGLRVRNFNNGFIDVVECQPFTRYGIVSDCSGTANVSNFNNQWRIAHIGQCGTNFATLAGNTVFGLQGNEIHFGDIIASTTGPGVNIDANQLNGNSQWNRFYYGAVEHNATFGILDNAGNNYHEVGNTNSNSNSSNTGSASNVGKGYGAPIGLTQPSTVRGRFQDGVTINTITDLTNWQTQPGSISAPSMPASGTACRSVVDRPAEVYVSGGTVTGIAVNGVATGLTSGRFRLLPGATITLTYSAAPSWVWDLSA